MSERASKHVRLIEYASKQGWQPYEIVVRLGASWEAMTDEEKEQVNDHYSSFIRHVFNTGVSP